MKLTKENKEDIEQYCLSAINTDGYISGEETAPKTDKGKLIFLLETFRQEYDFQIKRVGQQRAFAEWLAGLPSCYNIDFENYKILELAEKWGQETKTETQQFKILNAWFPFITNQTFKLFKKYKVL